MKQDMFRKESMERIASPDELHDYMRVTSPRLWMVLIVVIVLLAGFIVYASMAVMENTMDVKAEVSDTDIEGKSTADIVLYIPKERQDIVKNGMQVRVADTTATIDFVLSFGEETLYHANPNDPDYVLTPGIYDAEIILESISPLKFLLN